MTYFEAMEAAIELTVVTDSISGMSYLEPNYRLLLKESGISLPNDKDGSELYELLHLEVEKRNAKLNRLQPVLDWLYDVMTTTVDPAVTQEENELIKNVMDYMKLNSDLKVKEKELEQKEQGLEVKERVGNVIPFDINFNKKRP